MCCRKGLNWSMDVEDFSRYEELALESSAGCVCRSFVLEKFLYGDEHVDGKVEIDVSQSKSVIIDSK